MKEVVILSLVLLALMLTTLVSAVSIQLKETYSPGETLLATIEGNFLTPIEDKQIYFYEGRIPLPLLFDIGKFQDKYYIYVILPTQEKNLSLVIKQAHYIEATKEYKQDITENFSISGNLIDFSVSPGFVITNQDFEIKVVSIAKAVTVTSDFLGNQEQVSVSESAIKKIKFSIKNIANSSITQLKISSESTSYTIPVLIISNQTLLEIKERLSNKLKFSPSSRDIATTINSERELNIRLENLGNTDLEDIEFIIPKMFETMLKIEPENLSLKQDESTEIIIKINPDQQGFFSDLIEAETENASAFFNLTLSVVPETIPSSNGSQQLPDCASLKGQICKQGKECSGTEVDVTGGKCCLGDCQEKKASSSWKYVWILLIILVLLAIAYFFFKRYKKPGKSATEVLNQRQILAERRLALKSTGSEVKGKLDRF